MLLVPHHFAGALPKSHAEPDLEHSLTHKKGDSDPLGLHQFDPRPESCSREGPCDQADPQVDPNKVVKLANVSLSAYLCHVEPQTHRHQQQSEDD